MTTETAVTVTEDFLTELVLREIDGEETWVPIRQGIVAEYHQNELGYVIQHIPSHGYRWISVEAGEEDLYGPWVVSMRGALRGARDDWRENGQGDGWATWSQSLAADAAAPERFSAEELAGLLSNDPNISSALSEELVQQVASLVAGYVNR